MRNFVIGFIAGVVVPVLFRIIPRIIQDSRGDSIRFHRERRQMLAKSGDL